MFHKDAYCFWMSMQFCDLDCLLPQIVKAFWISSTSQECTNDFWTVITSCLMQRCTAITEFFDIWICTGFQKLQNDRASALNDCQVKQSIAVVLLRIEIDFVLDQKSNEWFRSTFRGKN